MDIFEQFLESIKNTITDEIHKMLDQIKAEITEEWVGKSEISRHLGQSLSWVSDNLNSIPHVKHENGALKFKKSDVDKWRIESFGKNYDEINTRSPVIKIKNSKRSWTPIE